ncbi:MAG: 2-oxoacid:acceptor oxidoreductase subunit alpha [Planctomycetia bacterium]|nr:MAG: 2-oxoacid:acceptor oxidoreductase subunit alpha [Planctomycetia bacterium]
MTPAASAPSASKQTLPLRSVTVRFAGDSGDGMQLAGTQFTSTSAVFGNDISTLPDFPAEIRAPAGTLAGVSGFQINFSSTEIFTPGDTLDALIAMNPAALKTNLPDLAEGGILIVNTDEFILQNFAKARYASDPLAGETVQRYQLYRIPITTHTIEALKGLDLSAKEAERCKNFYALGLVYWLYDRPLDTTLRWIDAKFSRKPELAEANRRAMTAGYHFGETAEIFPRQYRVERAALTPGKYRNITGNQALALGLISAGRLSGKPIVYASYPITPASDILHQLASQKHFDVRTLQAEDEIAAVTMALGASFAGSIGVTASSGPGIALKQEAVGLAVMTELPLVIIDVQRAGPSTGMPTKTEQTDLFQVLCGRNGECPAAVIAARSPSDCFNAAIEAVSVALRYMTPVFLLSDGFIANSSEPWPIPPIDSLPPIRVRHAEPSADFAPYRRDERGVRPWAIPGTPGLEHRVGGLSKADVTGHISYDPKNHQLMINLRAQKIRNIAAELPPAAVEGPVQGDLLMVSWGGTYGAIRTACEQARARGQRVSHLHLRWLNPLPRDLGEVLRAFGRVCVAELNMGQLRTLVRSEYLVDAAGLNKVEGRPFNVRDVAARIDELLR